MSHRHCRPALQVTAAAGCPPPLFTSVSPAAGQAQELRGPKQAHWIICEVARKLMPGSLGVPASTCALPDPLRPYASTHALMPFITPDTRPLTSPYTASWPCIGKSNVLSSQACKSMDYHQRKSAHNINAFALQPQHNWHIGVVMHCIKLLLSNQ